jgi:carbonic anhydrase/acetyltransferase-like protein (isoleucine patch superfamily)
MNDGSEVPQGGSFGPAVHIEAPAYIDPTARLYGKISLAPDCSMFPYAVIRAESQEVRIGRYVNMQDHVVIHVGAGMGTHIGDYCSITHRATVHGARIGENSLVGINATVMDGAVVGENCVIGAHCVIPEGTKIPDNSVVLGVPGKVIKTRNNFIANRRNAMIYHWNALAFARGDHRGWEGDDYQDWFNGMQADLEREFRDRYPEAIL